jgi:hypothetical protein
LNFCLPISTSHLVFISGSSNFCLAFQSEYLRYCSFYLRSLFCSLFPVVLPAITSDSLLRHYCGAREWNYEVSKPIACSFSTWYSTLYHYPKNGGTVLHFRDFNVLISTPAGKRLTRKGGWEGRRNSYRILSENLKRKIVFGILWNNFKEIACQVWTERRYFMMRDAKGISEYVNEPSISAKRATVTNKLSAVLPRTSSVQ